MDWVDLGRRWGRGAVALGLLGALWLLAGPKQEAAAPVSIGGPGLGSAHGATGAAAATASTPPKIKHYVVHVAGAVRHPGVYKVRAPGRLIDAVKRAGGLTAGADLTQVNLAARLTDGRQIVVPLMAGAASAASGGAGTSGGEAATLAPGVKLSANAATAEQLDGLDGVGPAMAEAIIALRTKLGGFTSLDQLDDVSGVGEKRLASLREQLEL